jgi:hypothetical protein
MSKWSQNMKLAQMDVLFGRFVVTLPNSGEVAVPSAFPGKSICPKARACQPEIVTVHQPLSSSGTILKSTSGLVVRKPRRC